MAGRGIAYRLWAAVETERVRRGWTAVRMAEHIGLSRNTIARLKDAEKKPFADTVQQIADALEMDRDEAARMAGLLPSLPGDAEDDDEIGMILEEPRISDEVKAELIEHVRTRRRQNDEILRRDVEMMLRARASGQ